MGECEKLPIMEQYTARFSRVLAHLEAHSEEAASLDELGDLAAFSRHHFHRQFSGYLGMSVYRYVQFMRMRRASWRLAFRPELSVGEIALATGYEGPEAFARAFRQYAGQSPSEFREDPNWAEWHSRFRPFIHLRQNTMSTLEARPTVRIVSFPATRVAALEHRGSPLQLGDTIRKFIDWRKANALPPRSSATFNIIYNDPEETPPAEFRFSLCAATDKPIKPNETGVTSLTIPTGRCALLRHVGSDDQLGRSIRHLYALWLPGSGETPRDFPLFMQRLAFFPDVPDSEAVTDIYLPLM
ncbi:MAG: AraC family transcriptional regulator [Pseudomonadota bacterium]